MAKLCGLFVVAAFALATFTPSSAIGLDEVLDIIKVGKDIVVSLAKAWDLVDEHYEFADIPPPFIKKTERKLFQKMDHIQRKMDELNSEIQAVGTQTISGFMHDLPERIRLELRLNDLLDYMTRLNVFYGDYLNYVGHSDDFERLTMEDFAKTVVSHNSGSVRSLIERIHAFIAPSESGLTDPGILGPISNTLQLCLRDKLGDWNSRNKSFYVTPLDIYFFMKPLPMTLPCNFR